MSTDKRKRSSVTHKRSAESNQKLGLRIIAVSVLLALLAGSYLWIVSENMKLTTVLWDKHLELNAIWNENAELEVKIAQESSIYSLIERSRKLGYEPATSVEFMQEP